MITNADITVYNKVYDSALGYDTYKRTTVYDIRWFGQIVSSVGTSGLSSADSYTVRIPTSAIAELNKTYVPPKTWKGLTSLDVPKYYTFQDGDKVVKGATNFEVTGASGHKWADIEKNFDEVLTVVGYADNRSGGLPHIKVVGK